MHLIRTFLQTSVLAGMVLTSLSIYSNPASAQQQACVITDEGATVCGKLTTQTKKPNSPSGYRKEVDKFVILLKGCSRSDATIKCNFVITNKGEERGFEIRAGQSSIIDSKGKPYSGTNGEIGADSHPGLARTTVSPGIDYAANITFEKIPEQITQIPLVNFHMGGKNVQYRNVSFSN
jgi:hypothetical protein